jgi:hypothetical protein
MDGLVMSYDIMIDYLQWKSVGTILIPGVYDPGDVLKTDGVDQVRKLAEKF